jgi:hypothetical protein
MTTMDVATARLEATYWICGTEWNILLQMQQAT